MTRRSARLTCHEMPAHEIEAAKAFCETMLRLRERRAPVRGPILAHAAGSRRLASFDLGALLA